MSTTISSPGCINCVEIGFPNHRPTGKRGFCCVAKFEDISSAHLCDRKGWNCWKGGPEGPPLPTTGRAGWCLRLGERRMSLRCALQHACCNHILDPLAKGVEGVNKQGDI